MTLAVVVATEPYGEGATAGLGYAGETTVLDRLLDRLRALNVPEIRIITRPDLGQRLRKNGHEVVESDGLAGDLRVIGQLAREAHRPLLILAGDLVASDELLIRLESGGKSEAAAVTGPYSDAQTRPPIRTGKHLIDSAGSRYHQVTNPNAVFRGALKVGLEAAPALAEVADELAGFVEAGPAEVEPVVRAGAVTEHIDIIVDNNVDGSLGGKSRGPLPVLLATTAPAGDDAPALLLVGLVRSGVRVTARDAGALVCERVLTPEQAAAARSAVEQVDEDRVRLDAAVKGDDGFFTTYAVSTYSKYLARWAAKLHLTPNVVTSISMAVAVVAAVWFAAGTRGGMIFGAVLLYAAFVLDCVDGQLARYTRQFSTLGAWLDATFDRAKEYVVYAGLAVGSTAAAAGSTVHSGDVWPLAVGALALQTVRHMVDFSFAASREALPPTPRPTRSLAEPGDGATVAAARPAPTGAGMKVAAISNRTEKITALRWAKKIVILPIGERFALICLTAAIFNARVTFLALLIWGSLAAAYTLTGRVLRSLAR